jgi:hypothetical protein
MIDYTFFLSNILERLRKRPVKDLSTQVRVFFFFFISVFNDHHVIQQQQDNEVNVYIPNRRKHNMYDNTVQYLRPE